MRTVLKFTINVYWNLIGNIILATIWFVVGIIFVVTIVFYDYGLRCLYMAVFVRKPFGKNIEFTGENRIFAYFWACSFGVAISLVTVVVMLVSFATFGGILFVKKWEQIIFATMYPFSVAISQK